MKNLIFILIVLTVVLKSLKLLIKRTKWFTEKLKLQMKKWNCIVWSVEKIQKVKTQGKLMLWLRCSVCDSSISRLIKKREANRLLIYLGLKISLGKIPLFIPRYFV